MQPLGEENLSFDGDIDGAMIGGPAPAAAAAVAAGGEWISFQVLSLL